MAPPIAYLYLALVAAALGGCSQREPPAVPGCTLEITADDSGRLALAFLVVNTGQELERGQLREPFADFELAVTIDGRPVSLVRPAPSPATGDAETRLEHLVLSPGSGHRLVPPVRLQFDADGRAEPGDPPAWAIVHPPAAVHVRAELTIPGLTPRLCEADYPAR